MALETVAGTLKIRKATTTAAGVTTIQDRTTNCGLVLTSGKVSVDVGKFIPGIYRVNPYLVYKESVSRGENVYQDSVINPAGYPAGTKVVTTLSGDTRVYFGQKSYEKRGSDPNFGNSAQLALQQAAAKLVESEAGLGESIGELKETLQTLVNPFKELREFLTNTDLKNLGLYNRIAQYAKSGVWGEVGGTNLRGSKAASAAASAWLELRYGLIPLIYTVQDLIKLVNKKVMEFDRTKIRTVRSSVKETERFLPQPWAALVGDTHCSCVTWKTDSKTTRACIQYYLDAPRSMQELLGLVPQFLPELAWELTGRSFVVDWWFSVGSWLGAFRGLFLEPTVRVLGNTVGMKVSRRVTTDVTTRALSVSYDPTPRGEGGYYAFDQYTRVINQSLPSFPLFKPNVNSVLHTIDGLALLLKPILGMLRR